MTTYLSIDNVVYNENDANAVFTLRVLGEPATTDITINLEKKVPGSGGVIYTVVVDPVTIPAGATEIQITLPLTSTSAPGFMLYLSTPTAGAVLTENRAVAVIQDGATAAVATPNFTAADAIVDEGAGTVTIQYTLDAPSASAVTVDYATHSLTGAAGEDFSAVSGTLTIAAGQTSGTLTIPLFTDGQIEGRESFAVSFGNASGATVTDPVVHVAIADQDVTGGAVVKPSVHVFGNVAFEDAGYVDFVVALDKPATGEVAVVYDTNPVPVSVTYPVTATSADFVRHTGTLIFAPGEMLKTVRVLLLDNPASAPTTQFVQFYTTLSVFGATHEVSNTTVTILNREYYDANPTPATLNIQQYLASKSGDVVAGTAYADSLTGGGGADLLDGQGGVDTMTGGLGDDTYILEQAGDTAIEAADGGVDTVITYLGSQTLSAEFENLVLASLTDMAATGTGNAADNLIVGNSGGNTLTGLEGSDTLEGGAGNDTLVGGAGDDVYGVDSLSDVVTELAGQGDDTIRAWISYSLTVGSNVENLSLAGRENINATGDANANVLTGNIGNNLLDGAAGNDTLSGGDGNDTLTGGLGSDEMAGGRGDDSYNVDAAGDVLVELVGEGVDTVTTTVNYTLTAGAQIERAYLGGTATSLGGNELDNALYGGALNDSLSGAAGNDTLDGGVGNDTMAGGVGDDVFIVDAATDVVSEVASAGTDQVRTALAAYTLGSNVENLLFTGATAVTGTGNGLNNQITGTIGNDTLSGAVGNDTLDGGIGDDSLVGGAGNDTYLVDSLADVLVETAGAGTDTVQTALTFTLAANFENLLLTGSGAVSGTGNTDANSLIGNAGNNTLTGLDGNDTLDGGAGLDTLIGGAGNDTYVVDSATETVTEVALGGTDTVQSGVTYSLAALAEVENVTLTGATAANATGNDKANVLTGNSAANALNGGVGNDSLAGGDGNDTLDGGTGSDSMTGGAGDDAYVVDDLADQVVETLGGGSDTVTTSVNFTLGAGSDVERLVLTGSANQLTGNELANTLVGGGLADTLTGGAGNDTLLGGVGADSMVGGLGDDTYEVDDAGDVVGELAGQGSDTVNASINFTVGTGLEVETVQLTGTATQLTGNELANTLLGGGLGDTIDAQDGNDTVQGGAGTDSLLGGIGNDSLGGGADADTLLGGDGNDSLDGGAGGDSLAGGTGNDLYLRDSSTDTVTEAADEGTDTVQSAVNYTLAANVENLTLTGAATNGGGNALDNTLTGNALNNLLAGAAGNDTIDGGAGSDSLYGGLGDDTYYRDAAGDAIVENLGEGSDIVIASVNTTLAANVENLILAAGATNGGGNALDNVITGNAVNNLLAGAAGNDTLDGGAGADSLYGGLGDDTFYRDNAGDAITESVGEGSDTVIASVNTTLAANVENLELGGAATNGGGNALANLLTGNALNNLLSGAAGDDTLNGGAGNDTLYGGAGSNTLIGGAGNDTYVVESAADVITEAGGEGSDTVQSAANLTLGTNLENLTLTGAATNGTGNALANVLTGNALNNLLSGADGNDSLVGAGGNDTLYGGAGSNNMAGGAGDDTYYRDSATDLIVEASGAGSDTVIASVNTTLAAELETLTLSGAATNGGGNALANVLNGNALGNVLAGAAGNDTLDGGLGVDTMYGGLGDDTFYRDSTADSVVENAGEGSDTVFSSVNYTLAANVEQLTLVGAATNGGGNTLDNLLTGNGLNNLLAGAWGADTLLGGLGNDSLYGGVGNDQFVFDTAPAVSNVDTIADWNAGDLIALDNDVYTALGAAGALAAGQFTSGAGVTGASVVGQVAGVYYDTSTGNLYYDADGFGGTAAEQFAAVVGKPALTAASFIVGE